MFGIAMNPERPAAATLTVCGGQTAAEPLNSELVVRSMTEPPQAAEFLQKRLISEFFGFQWQNLAEILSLFKKYNNLRKVAVREKV